MKRWLTLFVAISLTGCAQRGAVRTEEFYGTGEPFAGEAVYFVLTDRFVNGDPGNDQRKQGGAHPTFDRRIPGPNGESDNIGYLGGDFKGIVEHADYIRGMGFTAVWVTPIVDNPDESFTGGKPASWGSFWTDRGKTGYHGYWGVNFYRLDEHLPSPGLDFADFTAAMKARNLKVVLDIVANHGSPAYTMPRDQPKFGKVYDRDGRLLADQQNLPPEKLDPVRNPLHRFYNTKPGVAELSDFNENNPEVLDYLAGAYEQWAGQGAAAFRIDTLGWMPHAFWKKFADRIRARHPGFFMFGENFEYDAAKISPHTWPENGSISVLDFPLKQGMEDVFGKKRVGFERLAAALHLQDGLYANPYELMTFYDNHDMPRLDATDEGFIDANHWLFTARGIPVVYYGSEIGFMRGRAEHAGNRNYFGTEGIAAAMGHPIREKLARIAKLRAATPALQRGLQIDLELRGDRAAFYRVYQRGGVHQVALVLLNKGNAPARFEVRDKLQPGVWRGAFDGRTIEVAEGGALTADVPAHGVDVLLLDAPIVLPALRAVLVEAMGKSRRADAPAVLPPLKKGD
ncbi:cyclomaltodextrin glucanotransferase [Luteimonas gilva]|uniref:Cyclomaltodextrin glucanotransferase n=1 Tax=Luteimonas gilva TaxID=2572684 RepID=A0A4V5ZPZ7_9GAMM|nr:alpha-amylase family glycosyl hydrolase [Luteimonas gilva]TKR31043.1 cyclomaltodextrin glucanotransferase [Luteimonas gilva]